MKMRIWHDAGDDTYHIQHKWLGLIWSPYDDWDSTFGEYRAVKFHTLSSATLFIGSIKEERIRRENQKRLNLLMRNETESRRRKFSKVVHEETI